MNENNTTLNQEERNLVNHDEEMEGLLHPEKQMKNEQQPQAKPDDKPFKEKDTEIIPNKHEVLYCCGRKGVGYLIINSIQIFP